MRCNILDDPVDPVTGEVFCLEHAEVVQRPGPRVERCTHWCGYYGCVPDALGPEACCACRDAWVVAGELVAGDARYPNRRGGAEVTARVGR